MKQSKAEKMIDAKIEQIYKANCTNIAIDIFDIDKVFKVGRASIAAGNDDAATIKAIVDFVHQIRKN